MHLLKVSFLVIFTIATMRFVSWSFLWLLGRGLKRDSVSIRLVANILGLCGFTAFLSFDRLPGQGIDSQAFLFGIIVHGVFFAVDAMWLPRMLRIKRA